MLDLKNKKKLIALETNPEIPNKESFELQPLDPGFGITLGNALRRTLLSSLEGFCVSAIKIEGIVHEFFWSPSFRPPGHISTYDQEYA